MMMYKFDFGLVLRVVIGTFCAVGGGWVVWRGNSYDDSLLHGFSMVPAVMCGLTGMAFTLTGLAVVFRWKN
ncbi:MAG TPA: hypothetical protein VH518_14650 [Tepidisphaeraceae bacterium]|jgi:hypothetical protein